MKDLAHFSDKYKGDSVAIYGLGVETQKLMPELERHFEIIGLLDGYQCEGELYGKPVISLQKALEKHVKLIIVIARPGSCKAISRRIGQFCIDNNIDLFDIRGNNLCIAKKSSFDFSDITDGITKEKIQEQIDEHDVISVDLFDTLVMRQVIFPTDIFELIDCRLKEKHIFIDDFVGRRLESEKYLSKSMAPTLFQIYEFILEKCEDTDVCPEYLAQLEWETDCELIVPRTSMMSLIKNAFLNGKKIIIVSDTFYSREQVMNLLSQCHFKEYMEAYASCEYGTGKMQGLFDIVKQDNANSSILHIGDDVAADVESARCRGIDASPIHSGIELFEACGYLGLWDFIDGISEKIRIGMLVARLFNNPFQFETEKRKVTLYDAIDIGYVCFAPMICDFVIWFQEQMKNNHIRNIWFGARDGYLIKKLYEIYCKDDTSVYFLTSRTAAIRAGIENEEDISYVQAMKFSGTLQEQMLTRLGIDISGDCQSNEKKSLMDYADDILRQSEKNRQAYNAYVQKLNLKDGDIAFFDFVAKGTSQMFIQKIIEKPLKGFYFLQLEAEYMKDKDVNIMSFYPSEKKDESEIYNDYYILETMLTAPTPSISGFDKDGEACYADETREEKDINCFNEAQQGIIQYFKTYLKICPKEQVLVNKELDEKIMALIHGINLENKSFLNLKVEDPFFNRMTDITDLI